ncbi:MAG: hypothetical protein L6R37_006918 [Teloschistes peruensis]|nr:MAG: hypothetical protein L6R37_006918 [Teloschistes peruensis]
MSNTNGDKRAWMPEDDTQRTHKRIRTSPPRQPYTDDPTRNHRQTPQRPSSPTSHPSEDLEDLELARMEAELARRRQARATLRDRQQAERSLMLPTQPSLPDTRPSQMQDRGAHQNAYGLSQEVLGEDMQYGSSHLGYGTSVAGSSLQPVDAQHLANMALSYGAVVQNPRRQPTLSPPWRPQTVQTPPYVPGLSGESSIDPSFSSYLHGPFGIMPTQAYDSRFNALEQQFQPTAKFPGTHQQYFPQVAGPSASAPGMQQRLGSPFNPHGYPAQMNVSPSRERGRGDSEDSPEEPLPKTKRQKRLARDAREGMERGSDNKEKGQIRVDGHGNMWCCIDHKWLPAVYHPDRRERLLELAEQNGRLQYTHHQVHGLDPHDRTAYHPRYADINMKERNGRPRILYLWDPPATRPGCERDPGYMVDPDDHNIILIDKNNHPIRNHKELPVVISGQVPGVWMELWRRLNPYITNADIVARTPNTTCLGIGKKHHALTQQAFNNRARRDRVLLGTRAWSEREGSEQIQAQLRAIMPAHVLRELNERGSTAAWRDLTNEEITAVVSVNRGRGSALARAGARKLDERTKGERDTVANARDKAVLGRLMREKKKEDEKDGLQEIEEAPAGEVEQQSLAGEGSLSDLADRDRSASDGWRELASNPPTLSDVDAAETEQGNDATLVESNFDEGNTLVQLADLDKGGNPVGHADKEEPGDPDYLDTAVGSETSDQYQHPSTAGETSDANPEPSISRNQWTGYDEIRDFNFASLGYYMGNTGPNAAQFAGAVEEEPTRSPPSNSEGEVDTIQQPNADSGAAQSGDAVEEESAPPSIQEGNLDAVQDPNTQGGSQLDFSEFLNNDDQLAMNEFLEWPNGGGFEEYGGDFFEV